MKTDQYTGLQSLSLNPKFEFLSIATASIATATVTLGYAAKPLHFYQSSINQYKGEIHASICTVFS